MSGIEQEDRTGKAPSDQDVADAIEATTTQMVKGQILQMHPMLAVNIANIRRCLEHYAGIRRAAKEQA